MVYRETRGTKGIKETLVQPESKVHKVIKATKVIRAALVPQVFRVIRAIKVM